MKNRSRYNRESKLGMRYLLFLYWTPISKYKNRWAMVFSMSEGEKALAFFNANKLSPRGKVSSKGHFYPPPNGEFARWHDEVAKFPKPRSNSEICSGLKRKMKKFFFQGSVTRLSTHDGEILNQIELMSLRRITDFPAEKGWESFEMTTENSRKLLEEILTI